MRLIISPRFLDGVPRNPHLRYSIQGKGVFYLRRDIRDRVTFLDYGVGGLFGSVYATFGQVGQCIKNDLGVMK